MPRSASPFIVSGANGLAILGIVVMGVTGVMGVIGGGLIGGCSSKKRDPANDASPASGTPLDSHSSALPQRKLPSAGAEPDGGAPLSLTASDGTGLKIVSMKARAVVQEPIAFTELHLVFDNPESRVLEGRFTIDLPPGAAISRLAMKIDERWQEGEVVERQAARVAYEDFLHRKQDPALLEKQAGNRFSARVFPIPANGRKELIVSYSQELEDSREPYRLLLKGLPKLEKLDAQIIVDRPNAAPKGGATSVGGEEAMRKVITVLKDDFEPDRDLEVAAARIGDAVGLRHKDLALARVAAVGDLPADPLEDLTILFDTSASRALGFGGQLHRLHEVVKQLEGDPHLRVVAFDQRVSLVYDGKARGFTVEHLQKLYARRAMGASDISGAFKRLADTGAVSSRMLVVSDGIATAGKTDAAALKEAVSALGESGVKRIDALIDGGLQDRDALAAITTAGLARDGTVIDARLSASDVVAKLNLATISAIKVSVPGAQWTWPHEVDGVQPGDEVLVYAKLPEGQAMTVVFEGEDTIEREVETRTVSQPLLQRAWMGARIDALTWQRSELGEDKDKEKKKLFEEIVELSTTHRVLSDFTALLVLETEADYARFKIDRKALSDILTVGASGIEIADRAPPELAWRSDGFVPPVDAGRDGDEEAGGSGQRHKGEEGQMGHADEDIWGGLTGTEVGESFGVGGLGLVGTGRGGGGTGEGTIGLGNVGLIGRGGGGGTGSGYGRGSGAGFGGRGRRVPRVRQARAEVRGDLDKDIVRRIVRAHINEVRHCYNRGLARVPNLAGRVEIQFTVSPKGKVPVAVVASSTLSDRRVASCVAKAVRRWKFPKPADGGNAVVKYPFVLSPGGEDVPNTPQQQADRERDQAQERANADRGEFEAAKNRPTPYEGRMAEVMAVLQEGDAENALRDALAWRDEAPGDLLALIAIGETLEHKGQLAEAARAYGSLIDLFPARADIRRYAGNRLERLGAPGLPLAVDSYAQAVQQRADHPSSHRMYAYALVRTGEHEAAFTAIERATKEEHPGGRFAGVQQIINEDVGIIAAAWIRAEPARKEEIEARVAEIEGALVATTASTRFIMTWETDANDVDFHVYDGTGAHAFFSQRELPSGGQLYADVTTGYGPECFAIEGKPTSFPYRIEANYYSRGPMGYGMGTLQILQHDGDGKLSFEDRPFVIMKDRAYVMLGTFDAPLQ